MSNFKHPTFNLQAGQAMITAVISLLVISLLTVFGAIGPALNQSKISQNLIKSKKSYFFSEGSLEDAIYRISFGKNMPQQVVYQEGDFTATTTVSDAGYSGIQRKQIQVEGNQSGIFRKLESFVTESVGTVFNYASQVGDLGLNMYSNSEVKGNVFTNGSIVGYGNSRISGDALAAGTISSPDPTVTGQKSEGVDPISLPFLDVNYWEAQANINNDPIQGDVEYNSGSYELGPRRINGSLRLNNNVKLTITGPLHITGDFEANNNSVISLDDSFGSGGTVVIVEGAIRFNSNSEVKATKGDPKGYIIFAGLKSGSGAIEVNSNAEIDGVVYALNGWVQINSNAEITSVAGQGVTLNSNAELDYDLGLKDLRLTGGPSGGWKIDNWREF